jgi:uncharacterized protein
MRRELLMFSFLLAAIPAEAEDRVDAILANSLTAYVRPSYAAMQLAAVNLVGTAKALCATPTSENLSAAQLAFKDTALAWSRVEWFRSGTVMNDNRLERMFYFPDRKGVGLKQVQSALSTQDVDVATSEKLATNSVALQGLGASEFLLFGTGSENLATKDGAFRCTYVLASAQTLSTIASDLEMGWVDKSESSALWQKPAANNPFFRNDAEALNLLVGTLIHGLDAIRDMRLNAFLGKTPEADKPKLAAYWRSEATFPSIAANLEGLQTFYEGSDMQSVLPAGNEALLRTIKFDFGQAIKAAKALDMPVADVVADAELRKKAAYLELTVQILIDHFNGEFAKAAGLDAGFSFGDGD